MNRRVIYVPGLGDHKAYFQNVGIQLWRIYGLKPHYLSLGWQNKDGFSEKLKKLETLIRNLSKDGSAVSLIGVSAGASAVLNFYAGHPDIYKVVLICGKVQNRDNIHPERYRKNPDFKESIESLDRSLSVLKQRDNLGNILSIYSDNDRTVPPEDAYVSGAMHKKIFAWSHASVIFLGIILHGRTIAKFVRS